MVEIDNESPPGSWQKEWDARSHSVKEYQQEIRDLRDRIKSYIKEIEDLNRNIESLKEELALQNKFWAKSIGMDK